ncbi:MAG: altronate dehydratase family protein [Pseudomonadales bacterium]
MEFIHLHDNDTVVVALEPLAAGVCIHLPGGEVAISTELLPGHKYAARPIFVGEAVYKYAAPIGYATADIALGEHVHTHNMKTTLSGIENYEYQPQLPISRQNSEDTKRHFMGYRRANGKVGTRNEIWIMSTVGCVSRLAQKIAIKAEVLHETQCDGVFAFTHPFGCSQTGDDLDSTRDIMAALAQHPNAGGVLVLGLGCENNQGKNLLAKIPAEFHSRIRFFNCQQAEDEIAEGLAAVAELAELASQDQRTECPLSDLVLGMKCGGSDGFSGLSANPLVGRMADRLCDVGGTVLLTETPEMFGAEQILMNRACDEAVFEQTVSLINDFKQYFLDYKQNIYDNPSPGNKDGGITTLEEKSMGAIQKGGTATVRGVLAYAEPVKQSGLNLLQSPGNDAVSSTALTASGATVILFTTGRGTPLGFPAPTVKISSNTGLAQAKKNWIDFDAGQLFSQHSMASLADEFIEYIIQVASGQQTCSERNDQREIAIWKNGVTL